MNDDPAAGDGTRRDKTRRSDAQRNRLLAVRAAAHLLRRRQPLTMRAVAQTAGISRSTLYRHFGNPAALHRAVQQETLAQARRAIERSLRQRKPPLGELRSAVLAFVQVGARRPLDAPTGPPPDESLADAGDALHSLAQRLADAAGLAPALTRPWLRAAIAHFVATCLRRGWEDPSEVHGTVEELLHVITDPLDRGLLLLDCDGAVVALNPDARVALGGVGTEPGRPVVIRAGGLYEDGSPASPQTHPVTAALASREGQEGIRGHRSRDGSLRWFSIDVRPLFRPFGEELYGFVAVFTDVSAEKRLELTHLRPPGELGATAAPLLDVVRVLDEVPAPLLPEQLVAEAMRLAGGPAALYVLDIDGSHLLRLAGREDFPARLKAPLALGPELAEDGLPALTAHLANELPGAVMAPMWLRGRAVGVLLALRGSESGLHEVARLGAAAMELANGYTDVIDAARRRKEMNPAAEIQQSLIPPRIARMGSGELAGSVLPSYDVGGDWFDYVDNRDGAWIAIADASGKGPQAAGLGSVALAALRAARRNDATLEQAAQVMHETVSDVGGPEFFVTAIIARWHPVHSVLSWINCGHPPPLLLHIDDTLEELATKPDLPLGLLERTRQFRRHQRRLLHDDRLVFYSDGISRRRTSDGLFGTQGIAKAAKAADGHSATATARAIQEAVVSASEDPLPDDAAVIVLAANAAPSGLTGPDSRRRPA
jgi:serine phosphatase RsbU (regulator of sigma subunit)/AcrR family transcriptional regulator